MIAAAITVLHPQSKTETSSLDNLREEMRRFDPHVVVCSQPNSVEPGGRLAWVELPLHPTRPIKTCVGGVHSEISNPALEALLRVIEEAEKLEGRGGGRAGC